MRFAHRVVAGLACAAACHAALADRSRLAEDSEVIEAGDCEIEAGIERAKARDAARERSSSMQLNCGIGWRTELAATFVTTRSDGSRDRGFGVEAKTSLRDRGEGQLGWSLAYGVQAERGSSSRWRHAEQFIAIEVTYALGRDWLVEARLGAARDRVSRSDSTVWTLGAERALTESVEARLEVSGDDRHRPQWNAGLRFAVWPEHALLSVFYGGRSGPQRERQAGVALTIEF